MPIWIRSQNKRALIRCEVLGTIDTDDNKFKIVVDTDSRTRVTLGVYNTEQRVIEVLNDIQNTILSNMDSEPTMFIMPEK